MRLDTFTCLAIILCYFQPLTSQTTISGIINTYAKVVAIDTCQSRLSLSGDISFEIGQTVLLIQMKGTSINQSNSDSFGDISDLGGTGLFEKGEIVAITGSDIFLKNTLVNQYDVAGDVQVVSLPKFADAIVSDSLKAKSWDGSSGGLLALEVENTLRLEAPIVADGIGFRGGNQNILESNCNFLTNANNYAYSLTNWRGAPKGEGIAAPIPNKEVGRGAQANGGGGGNDHNSGGGGGANISAGGIGGQQDPPSIFGCSGDFPGKGGKGLPSLPNRLYLGGGGGAGDADDAGAGSVGGKGGGIVIIVANTIDGNGQRLSANGMTPPLAGGDGAGGGGGGGTIVLAVQTIENNLIVEAKGGNGGDVTNPPERCFGPGGGGSGGRLLTNSSSFGNMDLSGGSPGVNTTLSDKCNGLSNEAEAGAIGLQETLAELPESDMEIADFAILNQASFDLVCEGEEVSLEVEATGTYLSFQWQQDSGNDFVDLINSATISGATSAVLTLLNPTTDMTGFQYRAVIGSSCGGELFSQAAELSVRPLPKADFTFTPLDNTTFQFENLSSNANSFEWTFGDGASTDEINPVHIYGEAGVYEVTLTTSNDCGTATLTQEVTVGSFPFAAFTVNTTAGCVPVSVQFTDQSSGTGITSWLWSFPGGNPASSNEQNPIVTYHSPGTFDVELTVANAFGSHTTLQEDFITADSFPVAAFTFELEDFTASFTNNSQGGITFSWDFGDGTPVSHEVNPVHNYSSDGLFTVTLAVSNLVCGTTVSQDIFIEPPVGAKEVAINSSIKIYPNPVSDLFRIEFENPPPEAIRIKLFDPSGLLVKEVISQREREINFKMGHYPTGLYFLQIVGKDWQIARKVIKE